MLVLINPNNRILSSYAGIEPPLWAGLLATHYRNQGGKVAIVDAEALDLTPEQTVYEVLGYKPSMVMLVIMGNNPSVSSTPKMGVAKELVNLLKGKVPMSITGLHPSALPVETEDELGIPVLQGKIFEGMPNVAWDLLPMEKYRAHNWHCLDGSPRQPYASIYTSMNCPFSCNYCNIHALYGGKHNIQYREPLDVAGEIDILVNKYGVRNIKFWDELFTFNRKHVSDVCDEIIKRHYDLNIWAYARVDSVTSGVLAKMKQAGINWLAYGFEAGSNKTLNNIHKRATRKVAEKAVSLTHEAGINVMGNFIFGLPGETRADMMDTLEFAESLDIEYVNFYEMFAYPGSELYKVRQGNWSNYDQYGVTRGEVGEFRDRAFVEYFTSPNYLVNIGRRFGARPVADILEMVKSGKPVTRGIDKVEIV